MKAPGGSVAFALVVAAFAACSNGASDTTTENAPQIAPRRVGETDLRQKRPERWHGREELPAKRRRERRRDQEDATPRDSNLYPGAHGGLWRRAREPADAVADEERQRLEELAAVPYLSGYVEAPAEQDVIRYDPARAHNGYNLYNSGHGPEALLIDMEGQPLHSWSLGKEAVWPDAPTRKMAFYWRRVRVYPNGDLLVVFDSYGLMKLDRDSNLLWKYTRACHHDLEVTDNGDIYVLYRESAVLEDYNDGRRVMPDGVVVLTSDGEPKEEYRILECFNNSNYAYMLRWIPPDVQDLLHANSVRVFDGSHEHLSPFYKEGNILIALRKIDVVAIIDPDERSVVWATSGIENGLWHKQHDPRVLADGTMLLFDNRGRGDVERTSVLEFDPFTLRVNWQFGGGTGASLYSRTLGASRRLPNGNTLISESNYGRAVEVTREGEIVWEFINPHRAGDENELIATLFEMQRLDYDYVRFLSAP